AGNPNLAHLRAANALGVPSGNSNDCTDSATCAFVSLGDGGSITLEFVDNRLTGSGDGTPDLWVFEVGSIEDMFVAISKDGVDFFDPGKVSGSTQGIDIDAFGFGPTDRFRFVRVTDDPSQGPPPDGTAGADIDAVGAISSVPPPALDHFLLYKVKPGSGAP